MLLFHYLNRPWRRFVIPNNPVSYYGRITRFNITRRFRRT